MMFQYLFAKEFPVDMCIYLGGGDFLMPQHLLDSAEVGAAFQQVGGERMTEGMGTYVFMDTGGLRLLLDDMKYHDTGEGRSSPA